MTFQRTPHRFDEYFVHKSLNRSLHNRRPGSERARAGKAACTVTGVRLITGHSLSAVVGCKVEPDADRPAADLGVSGMAVGVYDANVSSISPTVEIDHSS